MIFKQLAVVGAQFITDGVSLSMRRWLYRGLALPLFVMTAVTCAKAPSASAGPEAAPPPAATRLVVHDGRVETIWDTYGVPHIFAKDVDAAMFAFGWSQMRAHGDLLLRLYAQARGESAAILGESYVPSDQWMLTNDVPERAAAWLEQQRPAERSIIDAFVNGINEYAKVHPDSVNARLRAVLPVKATDVLAHMQRAIIYTFMAPPQSVIGQERTWEAGSNAWAIAPARSASRNALLLANPHLPWGDVFTWFEAQISTPEGDAYGAAFVGVPLLSIAFNDSLGWSHTVNTIDNTDLYELTLSGDGYLYDGAVRSFETTQKTIRVRQPGGAVASRSFQVKRSVHGPVVGDKAGKALALRVAGLDAPHLIQQTWDAMTAKNLAGFERAFSRLQLPMVTTIYADHAGNIMSLFNGRVPARSRGDARYWQGVVRGDSSATLWTDVLQYDQLPRVINPPTGWVQNANDPPWTTTIPLQIDPRRYPEYVAPPPRMSFRAIRSARMLAEDGSITFAEMLAYKHSTRSEEADHILEDVVSVARKSTSENIREAARVLEQWDRSTDAESRGAVLFLEFARAFNARAANGGSGFDAAWSVRAPLATPDGIADAPATLRVLEAAAVRVRARYGALDVKWGDVYRLKRDAVDLPANGGPQDIGIFRTVTVDSIAPTRSVASGGDSFIMAVEFSSPVRAQASLVYGNWSQAGSKHRTDQMELFARKEMRIVWRTRAELEGHIEAREVF
ncbi:MAG: acylase [Longimicrobiales bacterium]